MTKAIVAAMLVAFLSFVAPLAAATPWLGVGGGPARTYATADAVPSVAEIAFQVELPVNISGDQFHIHEPVILDGHIYVMGVDGVYRIPVATGEVQHLVPIDPAVNPHSVVSDGRHLFVDTQQSVASYALNGALRWETPFPALVRGSPRNDCVEPIAAGGSVFIHCRQVDRDVPGRVGPGLPLVGNPVNPRSVVDNKVFLASYDSDTGAERWRTDVPVAGNVPASDPSAAAAATSPYPQFLAYVDGVLITQWYEMAAYDSNTFTARRVDAYDSVSGSRIWGEQRRPPTEDPGTRDPEVEYPMSGKRQGPFAVGTSVVTLLDDLQRFDARTGELQWEVPFDEYTHSPRFAPVRDGIIVAWAGTITRRDKDGAVAETIAQLDNDRMWNGLAATDDWVVGIAHDMRCGPNPAVDKTNPQDCLDREAEGGEGPGRSQWLHVYGPEGAHWVREFRAIDPDFALAEGIILVSGYPRTLTVYGRTGASIGLVAAASNTYPPPGAPVTLDLASTTPGRFDPGLEFTVDWGDGTIDGPQASPLFTHAYDSAGDHAALVTANNSAGQSSAEQIVFHVGGTPPVPKTFLATQFSAENQERTFFVLGLAVTTIAGVFGVGQVQRRRRRLQKELASIEEIFQMTRDRPAECERALGERRTRVRGMLVDGALDENQFGVLDRRIEELSRQVRLGAIDEELGFLSVSTARTLRGILADGRVESWERQHFIEAIERDALLTPEQKSKVKALVDEWLAQDARPRP